MYFCLFFNLKNLITMQKIGEVRGYNVYRDIHGVIYIGHMRYFLHSKTSAIAAFRKLFKKCTK